MELIGLHKTYHLISLMNPKWQSLVKICKCIGYVNYVRVNLKGNIPISIYGINFRNDITYCLFGDQKIVRKFGYL